VRQQKTTGFRNGIPIRNFALWYRKSSMQKQVNSCMVLISGKSIHLRALLKKTWIPPVQKQQPWKHIAGLPEAT